jgi:hypothetical protein
VLSHDNLIEVLGEMSTSGSDELTQDTVFDLLSNARRRLILSYLQQADESVDIFELARKISAVENDIDVEDVSDKQEKRVYVSIYQTHIPKLESAGLIEYDSDSGELTLTNRTNAFGEFLPSEESSRPWHLYYLGLAVASLLTLAIVQFAVTVSSTTEVIVQSAVVLAFTGLALVHVYRTRMGESNPSFEWLRQ